MLSHIVYGSLSALYIWWKAWKVLKLGPVSYQSHRSLFPSGSGISSSADSYTELEPLYSSMISRAGSCFSSSRLGRMSGLLYARSFEQPSEHKHEELCVRGMDLWLR